MNHQMGTKAASKKRPLEKEDPFVERLKLKRPFIMHE